MADTVTILTGASDSGVVMGGGRFLRSIRVPRAVVSETATRLVLLTNVLPNGSGAAGLVMEPDSSQVPKPWYLLFTGGLEIGDYWEVVVPWEVGRAVGNHYLTLRTTNNSFVAVNAISNLAFELCWTVE